MEEYQDQSHLTFLMIPPNPNVDRVSNAGTVSRAGAGSSIGVGGRAGVEVARDKLASHPGLKDSDMQSLTITW